MEKFIILYFLSLGYTKEVSIGIASLSVLETGGYSSSIYLKTNNLFGMNYPRKRQTTAIGKYDTKDGTKAVYTDFTESLYDFHLWMQYTEGDKVKTLNEFINHLKSKGYAVDKNHSYKVKKISENVARNF